MLRNETSPRGRIGCFCKRHPLFAAALVASSCVAVADWNMPAAVGLGLLLGFAGRYLSGWKTGLAWLFCGWFAVGIFTWRNESRITDERELLKFSGGEIQGRLLADPRGSGRFWSAPVVLATGPRPGARVWWEGRGELPVAGSWVKSKGNFGPLEEPRNPGDFNQAAWLRSLGVAVVFQASWVEGRVKTGEWAAFGARLRQGFRTSVTDGLPEDSREAIVIRAVVIGEKPPDADELIAAFRNSGTLHAFSVSGLHVAMVGSFCWILLRLAGVPRRRAIIVLIPLVFGYSWLTGNSPPAMRSAWMAAVFLMAFVFRRKPDLLNALGAVLLAAALWDGRLLFQPGVQLSYGVVAAIAVGAGLATRLFEWMGKPELYLPLAEMNRWQAASLWVRRWIARTLGVSVAAGVGSAPLTAFHFGMVTPVSVLAGLFIVPLIFVLLAAALCSAVLHPVVPSAARVVNRGNGWVAEICTFTAERFAALPGGHFQVRWDDRPYLLIYDLEHGAGAACFSGGSGGGVLLDCADLYGFKKRLSPSLQRLGVAPDSVVLSHPDGNHLGGGAAVWETFPIRQVVLPVEKSRSPAFRSWINDAPRAGMKTIQAAKLKSIPMPDGAFLEILHVPDSLSQNALADDRVMISRLHWRGWKLLFTSDAGMKTERAMLGTGKNVSADVIIAGRNRGDESLGDAFLKAVNPQAIIASHSEFPLAEKLDPRAVAYWRSQGIRVIHQGESGGVTIRVDESGNLRLEGFADHSEMILMPR
ncbi:MAG: ComEC/Rec2 family competence protein [Verrucomicrobiota bacterium]